MGIDDLHDPFDPFDSLGPPLTGIVEPLFPLKPMEEYENQIQEAAKIDIFNPEEDDLCLKLDNYESSIERTTEGVGLDGTHESISHEDEDFHSPFIQKEFVVKPPKHLGSPNPPIPEEPIRGWKEPILFGFGKIGRGGKGIRNSQDVYCERQGRRRDHHECIDNECPDWDSELQICRYGDEEWKKSEENEN